MLNDQNYGYSMSKTDERSSEKIKMKQTVVVIIDARIMLTGSVFNSCL